MNLSEVLKKKSDEKKVNWPFSYIYIYVYVNIQHRIHKCKYTDTYTYLYIYIYITSFIGGAVGGLPLLIKEKKAVSNIMLCGSAMAYGGEVFFFCRFIWLDAHSLLVYSWARGVLGCWCTCLCVCVCVRVFFVYIQVYIRPGCLCLCVCVCIHIHIHIYIYLTANIWTCPDNLSHLEGL